MIPTTSLPPAELLNTPATQRPPHWRYLQAEADAAADRFRLPAAADPTLRKMTYFLAQIQGAASDDQRWRIMQTRHFLPFAAAFRLWQDCEQAAQLEASILARMNPATSGQQLSIRRPVIRVYQRLFFDVTRRLDDVHYIHSRAIATTGLRGDPKTAFARTGRKALAYYCGPKALQHLSGIDLPKPPDLWRSPAEVTQRLAFIGAVERFGALLCGSATLAGPAHAAEIESLRELMEQAVGSEPYPRHRVAWMVQK